MKLFPKRLDWSWARRLRRRFSRRLPRAIPVFDRSAASPAPQHWDPQRTLAGLKAALAVLALVGVVVGWRALEKRLQQRVRHRQVVRITPPRVRLAEAPRWMSAALRQHIQTLTAAQIGSDPLDAQSLERTLLALKRSPWVDSVNRVERLKDWVIVAATYREPVAVVQVQSGYRLVDAKAALLPGLFQPQHLAKLRLPAIVGVSAPPPSEGQVWPGPEVPAGLALAKAMANEPYRGQIQAFDVSQRDARGRVRLALLTRHGMVRWGLPPGQEQALEPEMATKKEWLAGLYQKTGAIDGGGRIIDLFGPAMYFHETAQSNAATAQVGGSREQSRPAGYTWVR